MINLKDGSITLKDENINLSPKLTLEEFKKSKLYNNQNITMSLSIGRHIIEGKIFYVRLYFIGEYLNSINLMIDDMELTSWTDEEKRKDIHDRILKEHGISPYEEFDWGNIVSSFDRKGWVSYIIVNYK